MWPVLIETQTPLGTMPVNTYGLFIVLAFSAAFAYVHVRTARIGVDPDKMIGAYLSAALGGLVGARVLYAVAVEPDFWSNPLSLFTSTGGFAFYGGVVGGAVGVLAYVRWLGLPVWKIADIAGPSVVIGLGVGRLACFWAGCCHGAVAPEAVGAIPLLGDFTGGEIWLSGTFPYLTTQFDHPRSVARILGVPLYPTQLWSVFAGLGIAAVLSWVWTKKRFDGQIAALTLIIEPPFRMFIEAFRADHRGTVMQFPMSESIASWFPGMNQAGSELHGATLGLTTSQFIGLLLMVVGIGVYLLRRNAGVEEEAPISDEAFLDLA